MRNGFQAPVQPSRALAAVLGFRGLTTRGQITKRLWRYIKRHDLQDPRDPRVVRLDAKLSKLFGRRRAVSMFQMTKLLQKHIRAKTYRR